MFKLNRNEKSVSFVKHDTHQIALNNGIKQLTIDLNNTLNQLFVNRECGILNINNIYDHHINDRYDHLLQSHTVDKMDMYRGFLHPYLRQIFQYIKKNKSNYSTHYIKFLTEENMLILLNRKQYGISRLSSSNNDNELANNYNMEAISALGNASSNIKYSITLDEDFETANDFIDYKTIQGINDKKTQLITKKLKEFKEPSHISLAHAYCTFHKPNVKSNIDIETIINSNLHHYYP